MESMNYSRSVPDPGKDSEGHGASDLSGGMWLRSRQKRAEKERCEGAWTEVGMGKGKNWYETSTGCD